MKNNGLKKALTAGVTITAIGALISSVSLAQRPKNIELSIDSQTINLESNAKSVSQVLDDYGYSLKKNAKINHDLDEDVVDGMKIDIQNKKMINFVNGGKSLKVNTHADSVATFLEEEGIIPSDRDIISPSITSGLEDGDSVKIDYVTSENYKQEEVFKFKTKVDYNDNLSYKVKKVKQEGKDGVLVNNFSKTFINGKLVSDKKISNEVKKAPINQVIEQGTRELVESSIPYKTITRKNSSMYVNQSRVINPGSKGLKRTVFKNDGKTRKLVSQQIVKNPKDRIVEKGTKKRPVRIAKTSSSRYSLSDLRFRGIIRWNGYKYTYYSQRVLPGRGLRIPGRHVNAGGFVADKDGYIVISNSRPRGTVVPTPFGYMGKVYDKGVYGNHLDVYTR